MMNEPPRIEKYLREKEEDGGGGRGIAVANLHLQDDKYQQRVSNDFSLEHHVAVQDLFRHSIKDSDSFINDINETSSNLAFNQPLSVTIGFRRKRSEKAGSSTCSGRRSFVNSSQSAFQMNKMILLPYLLLAALAITYTLCSDLSAHKPIQRNRANGGALALAPNGKQLLESSPDELDNIAPVQKVRRTNQINSSQLNNNNNKETDCPANRLIQALLPPEYQSSRQQQQQRAYCDCTADMFGWHLTCFATSGGGSSAERAGLSEPALPNQLHPAFRAPQMQRQQQQQQQAAAAQSHQHPLRRVYRSPMRTGNWMGDESTFSSAKNGSNSTSGKQQLQSASAIADSTAADSSSIHEGFGEEGIISQATTLRPQNSLANKMASYRSSSSSRNHQLKIPILTDTGNATGGGADTGNNPAFDESFMSLSSSASFSMLQQEGDFDNPPQAGAANRMSEKLIQQASSINNNIQQHLTFQTVPVLFSVKYTRNNMIEIDCDQAAPNYKPAMFQGFNVNEISSFTFNNCKLPSIPFSALLHRTGSGSGSASSGVGHSSNPNQRIASNRLRQQQAAAAFPSEINENRRRRRRNSLPSDSAEGDTADDEPSGVGKPARGEPAPEESAPIATALREDPEGVSDFANTSEVRNDINSKEVDPSSSSPTSSELSRIRSLTVNLNTVIEQRQLISLLTGLDQLEDLQLNYMQLNMTGLELPADFEADSSTSPLHITTTPANTPLVSLQMSATSGSGAILSTPSAATATSTTRPPPTGTQTISVLTAGTPTTPMPPATKVQPTSPTRNPTVLAAQTQPRLTTVHLPGSSTQAPTTTTGATSMAPALPTTTTTTTTTTGRPSGTATSATTSRQRGQQQSSSVQMLRPASAITLKPALGIGAPRGLMIGQATGTSPAALPTTQTLSGTTTPLPSSDTAAPRTSVPNVPLSGVLAATSQSITNSQQINNRNTNTITSTQGAGRAPTPTQWVVAPTGGSGQSVSYVNEQSRPASGSSSPSSGTTPAFNQGANGGVITTITNSNNQQQQQQQQNFNQQPNSIVWYQPSTPAAPFGINPTNNNFGNSNNSPQTTNGAPQASLLHSDGYGIRTSGPLPSSLNIYNINTPLRSNNQVGSTSGIGAGLRTLASFTASNGQSNYNNMLNQNRRVSDPNGIPTSPFTAAGGMNRLSAVVAGRQQQQQQQQQQQNNNNNFNGNFLNTMMVNTNQPSTSAGSSSGSGTDQDHLMSLLDHSPTGNSLNTFAGTSSASAALLDSSSNEMLADSSSFSSDSALFSRIPAGNLPSTLMSFANNANNNQPTTTTTTGNSGRFKRQAVSMSEFELSFGELLPNLRTLKLESFIDLSLTSGQPAPTNDRASNSRKPAIRRSKRQFHPSDAPTRDESHMSDSESDEAARVAPDSLLAEESNNPARTAHSAPGSSSQQLMAPEVRPSPSGIPTGNDWPPTRDESERDKEAAIASPATASPLSTPVTSAQAISMQQLARKRALLLVRMFSKLSKLRVLQLASNEIPLWPDNVLIDSHNSLQRLYLSSNNIRALSQNSFANLTELETLDLSANQLRQLSPDLFRDLWNLRQLRAVRNYFRKLPSRLFGQTSNKQGRGNNQLPAASESQVDEAAHSQQQQKRHHHHHRQRAHYGYKLESLDLSKNKYLAHLPADLFAQRGPLMSLNLSDCALGDQLAASQVSSQRQDAALRQQHSASSSSPGIELLFSSLPELTSISLRANKLRLLLSQPGLWAKNSRLQRLDLSYNQISSLNANLFNANASQLTDLQLQHNQLSQVPDQFLFNLRNLRRLSLAYNRLSQLSAKLFLTNAHLESIDLSHNQLVSLGTQQSSMIPFGNGARLKQLNLAHNNLSNFESDIFEIAWSFYTNLQLLDLSHNQFSGQIGVPIFYTIADELTLELGANSIQSVSVDALVQHEQILERYAAYEAEASGSGALDSPLSSRDAGTPSQSSAQLQRIPSVQVRLAGNPIACDCMLEPLISYSRRVAAATNPALVSSLFGPGSPTGGGLSQARDASGSLPAGSRYSVFPQEGGATSSAALHAGGPQQQQKNPQLFYQFKFNDLYCAKPATLRKRPLSHISIGDLLCPITDKRMCPNECQCHYQSAFKTAIVDCNGRQLSKIPEQLTSASNFAHFQVDSALEPQNSDENPELSLSLNSSSSSQVERLQLQAKQVIASVDKVIIRLDNNKLSSMSELSKLFSVVSSSPAAAAELGTAGGRFARAPQSRASPPATGAAALSSSSDSVNLSEENLTGSSSPALVSSELSSQVNGKRSPAFIGRSMQGANQNVAPANRQQQRQRRHQMDPFNSNLDRMLSPDITTGASSSSSAVLESAEEFRDKHYPITSCELYLDHNLIESIPLAFLEMLDQVRASSMRSALTPPQAALPTLMLEPPQHTKLNYIDNSLVSGSNHLTPPGSTTTTSASLLATSDSAGNLGSPESSIEEPETNHLFASGHQPLSAERKAALMETINQNVRLQAEQSNTVGSSTFGRSSSGGPPESANGVKNEPKVWVSPALAVLSLRHNKLAGISAKTLQRLSKLIRTSNTKLYLGHNPFNCSDNYSPPEKQQQQVAGGAAQEMQQSTDSLPIPAVLSPLGDQLMAASDSSSGAYLAEAGDDLAPAASDPAVSAAAAAAAPVGPLLPADCPIGQLKSWLTRHHSSVGDLDELYCVHGSPELAARIKAAVGGGVDNSSVAGAASPSGSLSRVARAIAPSSAGSVGSGRWEHEHPWAFGPFGNGSAANWLTPNAGELLSLVPGARLIELNMYDLCPYSGTPLLDPAASGLLSQGHQQILISVALAFILISLLLLMMLIYFGDTQTILAFVYIHMNPLYTCLRLSETHLDGDKLYDAFVSYSSEDRDIVMQLIERLERPSTPGSGSSFDALDSASQQQVDSNSSPYAGRAGGGTLSRRTNSFQDLSTMSRSTSRIMSPTGDESSEQVKNSGTSNQNGVNTPQQQLQPYRLCIHERDWLPGHLISWNIVNSVQNSRRTILILSKDFIKSVWFSVEFHTAYYQMLEDKIDRLIVIVRGELPPKSELDKNLAFLLTTKTYLTWGEKWFWERLHYALPHKSRPAGSVKVPAPRKHHHHYAASPAKLSSPKTAAQEQQQQHQRPLVMSSIGKDVSNLLLSNNTHNGGANKQQLTGSSSSTTALGSSASSATSSGGRETRSLLSSASSGNLMQQVGPSGQVTTSNELLSSTTRLVIGSPPMSNAADSGQGFSSSADSSAQQLIRSPGVTSIMLDGSHSNQQLGSPINQPNSRLRAKKQERLQNFVDQSISNHFNLSEL